MSNTETNVDNNDNDLEAFSVEFFGQTKQVEDVQEEQAKPSEEEETNEEVDALETDETQDTQEDDTTEEEAETEKPKRNKTQERIVELNTKYREQERKAQQLEAQLNEVLNKLNQGQTETPKTQASGPSPTDKNPDGTDKYELGEFDPKYIADLSKHEVETYMKEIRAKEAEEQTKKTLEAQRQTLEAGWSEKVDSAKERYPDFQEKGQNLLPLFDGLDQSYEEYLTATLMNMEFGPDVLYYLASNTDEAVKIVNAGPTKAAIALGRLEAKFAMAEATKEAALPRVSKAPTPPPINKGSAAAMPSIPLDTDDIDAFSGMFFNKKAK